MPKPDPAIEKLKRLSNLPAEATADEIAQLLRSSLADRSNRVVERAAEMAGEAGDESFVTDLLQAYRRLMDDPIKNDPGCLGKTAIVAALVQLEHKEAEIFREGIAYRQPEPIWGGEVDTAAELRGICAVGLTGAVSPVEVLNRCAVLLMDNCYEARCGAARAIGTMAKAEGAALLRLKLLMGDAAADVLGECCSALLRVDRSAGVAFVVQLLESRNGDMCVQAGLALGELRLPETFEPLRAAWRRQGDEFVRKSLLICIGLLRSAESSEFLLSLIDRRDLQSAADAIKALHVVGRAGEELRPRIQAAVDAIGDVRLKRTFEEEWREKL